MPLNIFCANCVDHRFRILDWGEYQILKVEQNPLNGKRIALGRGRLNVVEWGKGCRLLHSIILIIEF
jgi:hypothetical protein